MIKKLILAKYDVFSILPNYNIYFVKYTLILII